jgi:hypothetical protein
MAIGFIFLVPKNVKKLFYFFAYHFQKLNYKYISTRTWLSFECQTANFDFFLQIIGLNIWGSENIFAILTV